MLPSGRGLVPQPSITLAEMFVCNLFNMATKKNSTKKVNHYHKDGSLWATGSMLEDKMHGYWKWFRKDGIIMRSGYFDKGNQIGKWTTYDKEGNVYKVTEIKAKK